MSEVPGCSVCFEEVWEGAKFHCGHAFCPDCANGLFAALVQDADLESRKPGCQCERPFCATPRCLQCRTALCATRVNWNFMHSVVVTASTSEAPQFHRTAPQRDEGNTPPSNAVVEMQNEEDDVVFLGMTTSDGRFIPGSAHQIHSTLAGRADTSQSTAGNSRSHGTTSVTRHGEPSTPRNRNYTNRSNDRNRRLQ